jgi:putative ABC transport system permease protein
LLRQFLTESALLAAIGTAAGLLVAAWTTDFLLLFLPENSSYLHFKLDVRILAFSGLVAATTVLLFGLLPAVRASALSPNLALRTAAPNVARGRIGQAVLAAQIAISLVLVIGTGLFTRTLSKLNNLDPGFDRRGVVFARTFGPVTQGTFYRQLSQRLTDTPELAVAAMATYGPLSEASGWGTVTVPGYAPAPNESTTVFLDTVTPRYFETMGIALLSGRDFEERDRGWPIRVAAVNESFARHYFQGRSVIGQKIAFGAGSPMEIIALVRDTKHSTLREGPRDIAYWPLLPGNGGTIFARPKPGISLAWCEAALRAAVAAVSKEARVEAGPFAYVIQHSLDRDRLIAQLSGMLGILALTLAALGVYGVVAYGVSVRIPEIGIRIALGAERADVARMVLKETLGIAAAGILAGVPIARAASRLVASQLFGVSPSDPLTIGAASAVMVASALAAGYVPARRAARLDPMQALRYE